MFGLKQQQADLSGWKTIYRMKRKQATNQASHPISKITRQTNKQMENIGKHID
jgi:hypothetical protein